MFRCLHVHAFFHIYAHYGVSPINFLELRKHLRSYKISNSHFDFNSKKIANLTKNSQISPEKNSSRKPTALTDRAPRKILSENSWKIH